MYINYIYVGFKYDFNNRNCFPHSWSDKNESVKMPCRKPSTYRKQRGYAMLRI